jgi:hypothetical protein
VNGINSGFGAWNPLVWTALFLGIVAVVLSIRALGRKDYKKKTGQTKVYLSGNEEPEPEDLHVRGDALYWGMVEALSGYYRRARALHTGILSDYFAWIIVTLGIVFVLLAVGR